MNWCECLAEFQCPCAIGGSPKALTPSQASCGATRFTTQTNLQRSEGVADVESNEEEVEKPKFADSMARLLNSVASSVAVRCQLRSLSLASAA